MAPSKKGPGKPTEEQLGIANEPNPFASGKKPAQRRQNIVRSGNAGNSKPSPLPTASSAPTPDPNAAPPPLFPVGYKTPLSLLSERCQKNGWERPSVEPKRLPAGEDGKELWTASVAIRRKHPKTGELESIYFRPPPAPSPICVEKSSSIEAKHYVSLFALYRFSHNLRLNLQLPPQTRPYWSALEEYKKAVPKNKEWWFSLTPFETASAQAAVVAAAPPPSSFSTPASSASSRAPTPSSNSAAHPPTSSEKHWLAAPEVRMPTALRDLVETTIRSLMPTFEPTVSDDYEAELPSLEQQQTIAALTDLGFRRGHVLNAISYLESARRSPNSAGAASVHALLALPLRVAALEYLHLHTPESDLPPSLRHAKPSDSNARIATNKDSQALGLSWKARELSLKSGFPIELCEKVMAIDEVKGEEGVAVEVLGQRLIGGNGESILSGVKARDEGSIDAESLRERRDDEIQLLEGMLGDKRVRRLANCQGVEVALSRVKDRDDLSITILYHSYSRYPSPSILPAFYLTSASLPSYIILHLTSLVLNKFSSDESWKEMIEDGTGGVTSEVVDYLEQSWRQVVDRPPDARAVMRLLLENRSTPQPTPSGSGTNTPNLNSKRIVKPMPLRRMPAVDQKLIEHLRSNREKKAYKNMEAIRARLPAWSMRDRIVELIENNRVVIVSGETGSGKTTQVPSFIMDHLIATSRGSLTSIVVTQPRRVSAIGVATRVAAERCEDIRDPNSRFLVGYAIRGERLAGRDTKMLFCTTGVILSRLSRGGDRDLEGVSHIFIDEVHERSVDSDFLLLELRDILARNKTIKVILMSATINQKQFSDYFGGAPCIEIPGFTHPVTDHYLEDILPNLPPNYSPNANLKPSKKATQAQLHTMRQSFIARGVENERTLMALETLTRAEKIDYGLVGEVARYCIKRSKEMGDEGGLLVFMPGVMEIKLAIDAIHSVSGSEKIEVFPLHANLSSQEQTSVFRPVKPGYRKIVVATNVAETSITIDGIVYVIDCGRVKENTFDPETGIVKLVETWTSKAASRQRRGRAGRTRPGECFKLFSHFTEENAMSPHPTPEIVRIPLEMLCLQIKAMREDEDVKTFLGKALDPPDVRAVDSAWETLRRLGAIQEDGGTSARLTPLGAHLSMIPVDLRLGKMLILASIFRCLDPILTVVALLSSKPFFLSPMDKRDEAKKARSMFYASHSDLLSDVKAFDACLAAKAQSNSDLRNFAEDNFISLSAFRDILTLRNEYLTALSDIDFVPFRSPSSAPTLNENSGNENLLKAIIYAGTARLVKVKLPPAVFDKGISGAIERERESREVKYFEKDGRVFLHPGSLLFSETRFTAPFMSYFNKHVTSKPFLRDATEVPLYAVLLFGPKVRIDHSRGLRIGADDWLLMRAWPRIGVLVNSLRQLFDAELEANLEDPSSFRTASSVVVGAMLACLDRDGGIS